MRRGTQVSQHRDGIPESGRTGRRRSIPPGLTATTEVEIHGIGYPHT
jgi:hypothetical protein